jgi:enoyl-CoA hydratase
MTEQAVTREKIGEAIVVTLRWTDRRNALGPEEAAAVADELEEAARSDAAGLILSGEGAFCAGGDLRAFAEISASMDAAEIRTRVYGNVQRMIRALGTAPMPTIAAVDGAAVGLGMDMALACDTRLIGPQGWLQQGWGRAGLISATGGTAFLQRLHPGLVWRLLAEQPRLDAEDCARLGLGEAGDPSALEASLARVEALGAIPRDVLSAYAEIARPDWPSDAYFERCADLQAGFIGSQRFRDLAARVLEQTASR